MFATRVIPTLLVILAPTPKAAQPAVATVAKQPVVVTVRATPQVAGKTFRLGEIAEITGGDKAFVAQLADVEVGTSPLPGLMRSLFAADIVTRMRSRGIDPKRVTLQSPPSIRISRAAGEVPTDAMTEAAKAVLVESQGAAAADEIIEPLPMTTKLMVSPGKIEYRAGAPRGAR